MEKGLWERVPVVGRIRESPKETVLTHFSEASFSQSVECMWGNDVG